METQLTKFTKFATTMLLLLFTVQTFAQITYKNEEQGKGDGKGYGVRARAGKGTYKGAIYWLSFGRTTGQSLRVGDKAEFITPSRTTYTVEITEIVGWERIGRRDRRGRFDKTDPNYYKFRKSANGHTFLKIGNAGTDQWGKNFNAGYNFKTALNPDTETETRVDKTTGQITKIKHHNVKNIMLKADEGHRVFFKLKVTSKDRFGNTVKDNNIVLAGTESLDSPNEAYGVKMSAANKNKKVGVKIIEAFKEQNKNRFDVIVEQKTDTDGAVNLYATTPGYRNQPGNVNGNKINNEGDVMFAVTGVHEIEGMVQGSGAQSVSVGVLDLVDMGDLPATYETDNPDWADIDGVAEQLQAKHVIVPDLGPAFEDGLYVFRTPENDYSTILHTYQVVKKDASGNPVVQPETSGQYTGSYTITDDDLEAPQPMATLRQPKLRLGNIVDYDFKPNYSDDALGDDKNNQSDEATLVEIMQSCDVQVAVYNDTGKEAHLYYWMDKNQNKTFKDDHEFGHALVPVPNDPSKTKLVKVSMSELNFHTEVTQKRFVRFRLTSEEVRPEDDPDHKYRGILSRGEVEDVLMTILVPTMDVSQGAFECRDGIPQARLSFDQLPTHIQAGSGNTDAWTIYQTNDSDTFNPDKIDKTYTGSSSTFFTYLPEGRYSFRLIFNESKCEVDFNGQVLENREKYDLDGDGILDMCDMDDDNDGILDDDEGITNCIQAKTGTFQFGADKKSATTTLENNSNPLVTKAFPEVNVKVRLIQAESDGTIIKDAQGNPQLATEGEITATTLDGQASDFSKEVVGGSAINVRLPKQNNTSGNNIVLTRRHLLIEFFNKEGEPIKVQNPTFHFSGLGAKGTTTISTDGVNVTKNGTAVVKLVGANWTKLTGTENELLTTASSIRDKATDKNNVEASGSLQVDGEMQSIELQFKLDGDFDDEVKFLLTGCLPTDTDDDGIPDYRDLDSDGDGCPDAIEGGTNDENDKISFKYLQDVNDTTVPNALEQLKKQQMQNIKGAVGQEINVNRGVPKSLVKNGQVGQTIGTSQDETQTVCNIRVKDDINQTIQGIPVSGNVLTNDKEAVRVVDAKYYDKDGNPQKLEIGTETTIFGKDKAGNWVEAGKITLNKNGTYTYKPNATFIGDVPIDYTAENGAGYSDSAKLEIKVTPNHQLGENTNPLAQNDTQTAEQGTPTTVKILENDSDPEGDTLTVTDATLKNGFTLADGTATKLTLGTEQEIFKDGKKVGVLKVETDGTTTFTSEADFVGVVPFDYTISDGNGGTDDATVEITVVPSNTENDVYANDDAYITPADTPVSGKILTNDNIEGTLGKLTVNGTEITANDTKITLPEGELKINPDGTFTFTPKAGFVGTVVLPYEICNTDGKCDKATLYITVLPKMPNAQNDINQTLQNVPVGGNVLTNDDAELTKVKSAEYYDASGNPQELTVGTETTIYGKDKAGNWVEAGKITLNADGTYDYTPNATFIGQVPIDYVAETAPDANGNTKTSPARLDIKVTPIPEENKDTPPLAEDDTQTVEQGKTANLSILDNDSDPDGDTLKVKDATLKDGFTVGDGGTTNIEIGQPQDIYKNGKKVGTLTVNEDGTTTFVTDPKFEGKVPFDYTITDGKGETDTATVTITVLPKNNTNDVYANDDAKETPAETPVSGNIITNDVVEGTLDKITIGGTEITADGTTITVPEGKLVMNKDGSFTFTPKAGFVGTVLFPYEICNTDGKCDKATLYITVLPKAPNAQNDINQTIQNIPVSGDVLTNDDTELTKVKSAKYYDENGTTQVLPIGTETTIYGKNKVGNWVKAGTITLKSDGTYDYTPNATFIGQVPIDYIAETEPTKGTSQTSPARLDIKVIPTPKVGENTNPLAEDDTQTVEQGHTANLKILVNDSDPENDVLKVKLATLTNGFTVGKNGVPQITLGTPQEIFKGNKKVGTLTVNEDGTTTFVPEDDFVGRVPFDYTITDSNKVKEGTDTATVTITVLPKNDTNDVYANDDAKETPAETPVSGNILDNDVVEGTLDKITIGGKEITADGTTITVAEGTLEMNKDGSFTFTPKAGFVGTVLFPYEICNTDGKCDKATLYITVFDPCGSVSIPEVTIHASCADGVRGYITNFHTKAQGHTYSVEENGTVSTTVKINEFTGKITGMESAKTYTLIVTGTLGATKSCPKKLEINIPDLGVCDPDCTEVTPKPIISKKADCKNGASVEILNYDPDATYTITPENTGTPKEIITGNKITQLRYNILYTLTVTKKIKEGKCTEVREFSMFDIVGAPDGIDCTNCTSSDPITAPNIELNADCDDDTPSVTITDYDENAEYYKIVPNTNTNGDPITIDKKDNKWVISGLELGNDYKLKVRKDGCEALSDFEVEDTCRPCSELNKPQITVLSDTELGVRGFITNYSTAKNEVYSIEQIGKTTTEATIDNGKLLKLKRGESYQVIVKISFKNNTKECEKFVEFSVPNEPDESNKCEKPLLAPSFAKSVYCENGVKKAKIQITNYEDTLSYEISPNTNSAGTTLSVSAIGEVTDLDFDTTYIVVVKRKIKDTCVAKGVFSIGDDGVGCEDTCTEKVEPIELTTKNDCENGTKAQIKNLSDKVDYTILPRNNGESINLATGEISNLSPETNYTIIAKSKTCETSAKVDFMIVNECNPCNEFEKPSISVVNDCELGIRGFITNYDANLQYTYTPAITVDTTGKITSTLEAGKEYKVTATITFGNGKTCPKTTTFTVPSEPTTADCGNCDKPLPAPTFITKATCSGAMAKVASYDSEAKYVITPTTNGEKVKADGTINNVQYEIVYKVVVSKGNCKSSAIFSISKTGLICDEACSLDAIDLTIGNKCTATAKIKIDPNVDTYTITPTANGETIDMTTGKISNVQFETNYTIIAKSKNCKNTSVVTFSIVNDCKPEIELIKEGIFNDKNGNGVADKDETITYTFTINNKGNIPVKDLKITDAVLGLIDIDVTTLDNFTVVSGYDNATKSLAVEGKVTFTKDYVLKQKDIEAGKVVNTATAKGTYTKGDNEEETSDISDSNNPNDKGNDDDNDGNGKTDDDPTRTLLTQSPRIALEKEGVFTDENKNGFAEVGETITYTFTVTNTGNILVKDVTITDTVLGLADVDVTTLGNFTAVSGYDSATKSLAVGGKVTFTKSYVLKQKDIEAGGVDNKATAKATSTAGAVPPADSTDPTPTTPIDPNCKDCTTVKVQQGKPAIKLEKDGIFKDENKNGFAEVGETITYTFTVTNTGNILVKDVTITDTVLGLADVDVTKLDNFTAVSGYDSATKSLAVGGKVTFTKSYVLKQKDIEAGGVDNKATAKATSTAGAVPPADSTDPTPTTPIDPNCKDCTTVKVQQGKPAIKLEKDGIFNDENGNNFAEVGETIEYTFTVTNTGNIDLTNIEITDPKVTVSGELATLSVGQSNSTAFTAIYTLTAHDIKAGGVDNKATVTANSSNGEVTAESTDPTPTTPIDPNCVDCTTVKVDKGVPSIKLEKEGVFKDKNGNGFAEVGETIEYTFTVTNTGEVDLTNIKITDPKVTVSGELVTLSVGQSNSTAFTAVYTLTKEDIKAGGVDNKATVTANSSNGDVTAESTDPTPTTPIDPNCVDCTTVKVNKGVPSIKLEKEGVFKDENGNGFAEVGETIEYTFTVTNTGEVDLTNIKITDPKVTVSGELATLSVGQSNSTAFTAVYTLTEEDIKAGGVDNKATVTASSSNGEVTAESTDPTPTTPIDPNCVDCTTVKVDKGVPSIKLEKDGAFVDENGNGFAEAGETIKYSFKVTNTGEVDLTNIRITDITFTNTEIEVVGKLAKLKVGQSDSTTFTAIYTITEEDIDAGGVDNKAFVIAKTDGGEEVTAESIDPTPITPINPECESCTTVEVNTGVNIPKGFSPNGDNKNEVFEIKHLDKLYPNFRIRVYNRWGNLVYDYSNNGKRGKDVKWWDGYSTGRWNVSKNRKVPVGTYFYIIDFNGENKKPHQGWVYVIY